MEITYLNIMALILQVGPQQHGIGLTLVAEGGSFVKQGPSKDRHLTYLGVVMK